MRKKLIDEVNNKNKQKKADISLSIEKVNKINIQNLAKNIEFDNTTSNRKTTLENENQVDDDDDDYNDKTTSDINEYLLEENLNFLELNDFNNAQEKFNEEIFNM